MSHPDPYLYTFKHNPPDCSLLDPNLPSYRLELAKTLNWLQYVFTPKELKDQYIMYLESKSVVIPCIEDVADYLFTSIGKYAWILSNGGKLSNFSLDLNESLEKKVIAEAERIKVEKDRRKELESQRPKIDPNLLETIKIIQHIEDLIISRTFDPEKAQVIEILRELNPSKQVTARVIDSLMLMQREVTDTSVRDYAENIELMGERAQYVSECLSEILKQMGMELANKEVKTRKPRTPKQKKAEQLTKNIKHKRIDNTYNVISIDPTQIIGATALLVFNTKSKRVGLYVAANGNSLSLKGTTLQNYDESASKCKTLRKPENDLIHFRNAPGTKRVDVLMKTNIKGKEYPMNGRLNKDTMLLKVFK